ncbi:MAG: type VI secretion system baseplate subunit TssE [Rubrivivax sp.]|nr:type VI secretion system baseplate subunit TssE [Rubrivivax sp.]
MQRFAPYLIDRLMDGSPDASREAIAPSLTIEQLKDSVARDVEALLNTRTALSGETINSYRNASHSILRFGLDDFSSRSLANVADRTFICRAIERAIEDHEPRLRTVRVGLDERSAPGAGLRFSIHALLQIHPAAEPVSFDALLQTGTQQYRVASSNAALAAAR